jgi:hypothetical protein
LVTSGALCLNISTEQIAQFNLGTIGLLVPSFAELGSSSGRDPLLLVTRPLTAVNFTIGEGTESSPALTLGLDSFEIDFYAFIYDRWVRGFTIALTTDVGINLEFTSDADGNPALLPVLSGLSASDITVQVLNAEFLRESAAELEVVFPTLLDLALPQITGALGEFTLPSISGFGLTGLTLSKVTTDEDDFLAVNANLGATAQMLQGFEGLIELHPAFGEKLEEMAITPPVKVETEATLVGVRTPSPDSILAALQGKEDGAMPVVFIDVPEVDGKGRQLEYTYNINSGLYRPFISGPQLAISDGAFAMQGRHSLTVRARAVGDYTSLDEVGVTIEAVIDSVGPRIHGELTEWRSDGLHLHASDLVSDQVQFSLSAVGADAPALSWTGGIIDEDAVWSVVALSGAVQVWARDETGNVSTTELELSMPKKTTESGGCSASDSKGDWASGLLAGLVLIVLIGRRRFRIPMKALRSAGIAALFVGSALVPACNCSNNVAEICITNEDCVSQCEGNTIPLCTEAGECLCADDVPFGRVGQYSEMALDPVRGGAWVSAYNSTHGDLMVAKFDGTGRIPTEAWQFIDGVPDGPVVRPESENRDGIFAEGDNVGLYTDIAVNAAGTVFVSYYDKSHGSLKLASFADDAWHLHTIADGNRPSDPELGYELAGQYSSITLDANGVPSVAYYKQSKLGAEITSELIYALGTSPRPQGSADWSLTVVDTVTVVTDSSSLLPVPEGTGLFVNSARLANGEPVLIYYNRVDGDLMMSVRADGEFGEPTVVDGGEDKDVGWYPSLVVDDTDVVHIAYVDVIDNDILYINTDTLTPELVDDGYRLVGSTPDGLQKPEFHFVGDDSSIVFSGDRLIIGYQDATWHELLIAERDADSGIWGYVAVAGDEAPFTGGYGFYASAQTDTDDDVVMSSWVIDQPNYDAWVEIFRLPLGPED